MRQPKIIVVGGGLAGLMATIRVAEAGVPVELFSIVPVKRSHSVCAQGGINAAKNTKGEGDSTWHHFDDTVYGGDFLANQPPVKRMCDAAPGIIDLLDRMGVMFNRTPEGNLDYRRFGGTLFNRTAFAGATTGQQLLYALDEQVRRFESEGKVLKYEGWTFLSAVIDDGGVARGICAMDLKTMEVKTFPGRRRDLLRGRERRDFCALDELGGVHRERAIGAFPAGRGLRQRRIHPSASHGDSGRGQTAPDERIRARRRRPRVGAKESERLAPGAIHYRRTNAFTSLRNGIRNTATWCRVTLRRARSIRLFSN